jgi:predicted kinase
MEAVILIGIQGAGKTTFYRQRFFDTHLRLSLDILRTRPRQRALISACIAAGQRFVVDNTNVLREERADIIRLAKDGHFKVIGYFFEPQVEESLARNAQRGGKASVPAKGVLGTLKRLERPSPDEGFDQLHTVA